MKIPNPGYNTCCVCGCQFDSYKHPVTDYVKTKRKSEIWFNRDCLERLKDDNKKSGTSLIN